MDPYSAHIIATSRGADFRRDAEEERIAKHARESRADEQPAPAIRRPARARRPGLVQ
ncbi:hypothetical protein [Actinophytocola sediminis]